MLGWGITFSVRESKLSHVAARFEYQQFSKSAPMRLQVCLAAWPRFSSLHVPHAKSAFVFRIQTRWPLSSPGPRRVWRGSRFSIYSSGWEQRSNWQGSVMNEQERECQDCLLCAVAENADWEWRDHKFRLRGNVKIAYICCVCHSEFRIILRQDGTGTGEEWNKYGHISNWMGAAIQLARKWHERARTSTSLHCRVGFSY